MKLRINSCDNIYKDSLDVRFTKKCDNNCEFCIERDGIDSLGVSDVPNMIKNTIESGKTDILILGGEPLLLPDLVLEYIKGIREHVETIYITTSLPLVITEGEGYMFFREIIKLIDGINISIHHYDDNINSTVLHSKFPHERIDGFLTNELKLNPMFKSKLRVCCNLVNGFIDNKLEIETFIQKMKDIGVQHVKLNELQNVLADKYVSFERVYGIKLPSPFANGCQTELSMFNGIRVTLKRSCFCNTDPSIAKASISDLSKCILKLFDKNLKNRYFKVLYEDGTIEDGWLKK